MWMGLNHLLKEKRISNFLIKQLMTDVYRRHTDIKKTGNKGMGKNVQGT